MDFYEELGIPRTASLDQVRQAYRQLARLIHPDQQTDEALRRLAEIQMKRLNVMLAVLSNPERRSEYDRDLTRRASPAFPSPGIRALDFRHIAGRARALERSVWIWAAAALLGIAAIALAFALYGRATAPGASALRGPQPSIRPGAMQPQRKQFTRLSRDEPAARLPTTRRSAPVVKPKLSVHRGGTGLPLRPPEIVPPLDTILPPAAIPGVLSINSTPPAAPGFSGQWFYAMPAAMSKSRGLYMPEYIEMRIIADHDQLHGDYKSRYLVTDRAISPAVVFRFQGSACVPVSTLRWDGPGGAYGRVTLKLVSIDKLEVSWTASRLSEDLQLINGIATLVRKP